MNGGSDSNANTIGTRGASDGEKKIREESKQRKTICSRFRFSRHNQIQMHYSSSVRSIFSSFHVPIKQQFTIWINKVSVFERNFSPVSVIPHISFVLIPTEDFVHLLKLRKALVRQLRLGRWHGIALYFVILRLSSFSWNFADWAKNSLCEFEKPLSGTRESARLRGILSPSSHFNAYVTDPKLDDAAQTENERMKEWIPEPYIQLFYHDCFVGTVYIQ